MSSEPSTAMSEAQARVVVIKTDTDDLVKYSGNPAELPGVRFETQKALRRCGAFGLLIKHNAVRMKNGVICTEDIDTIPFVTSMVIDPYEGGYSYEKPCPDTSTRVSKMNDLRAATGLAPFVGYPNLNAVPDKLLKLAIPNQHEVQIEALAFALTQLSVFEDRQQANELLVECEYDGRKLGALLDEIESQATSEDITLVTGNRNSYKEAGLRGLPLTYESYKAFFKEFNKLEYRCPPADRMADRDLSQLIGTLFIKDPAHRQKWSDNLSQPIIRDHLGAIISGPPQTYKATKALALKILRGASVIAGIDEINQYSPAGAALISSNLPAAAPSGPPGPPSVNSVGEALLSDPRKSFTPSLVSDGSTASESSINVPKGEDGKYLYWAPPMKVCECGTPDGGRHIRYKWPCKWYRNPNKVGADDQGGQGTGGGRGAGGRGLGDAAGRGKGKSGKGKGKGKGAALLTEDQVKTALASILGAASSPSAESAAPAAASSAASSTGSNVHSCNIANYDNDAELSAILDSDALRADLMSFLGENAGVSNTEVVRDSVALRDSSNPDFVPCDSWVYGTHFAGPRALGAEIVINHWTPWPKRVSFMRANIFHSWDRVHDEIASETVGPQYGSNITVPIWSVDGPWRDTPWGRTDHFSRLSSELSNTSHESDVSVVHQSPMPVSLMDAANRFSTTPSIFTILDQGVRTVSDQPPRPRGSCVQHFAFDSVHSACPHSDVHPKSVPSPKSLPSGAAPPRVDSLTAEGPVLPIFRAPIDSGCTATCTNSLDVLINVRQCDEEFNVADGKKSRCVAVGDMPVILKDTKGSTFRFVFKGVRYVPDFKYTLLAVKQIWKDHRINSVFADENKLVFPGGREVKFDRRFTLPVVNLVSETLLSKGKSVSHPSLGEDHAGEHCCVGFHNIKSTAHVARLPAAQAGELMHRRCHLGLNKIRALPHVTGDAPKVLSSAPPSSCVHCAASQIRLAGHSGSLHAPDPKPGKLHLDLKGPFPLSIAGKYRYVAFFTDEYSRYVIVDFLRDKSEVIDATKRALAKFNALVGTPVDEAGVAQERPRVRTLHRDHEGGLESKQFECFRANQQLYSTTSAPHDHDLNPIAESVINVISTLATAYKSQSGAPIGFWPELIRMAVDWHNSAPQASVGSSTSDPQISPTQRFTLKQPKVMDLPAFGARTVVLKPPNHQSKTTLSTRGWVGMFLGRSSDAVGTYEVWVPSINRKVRSSSLTVDEEHFPWLGDRAHQPLTSAMSTARFLSDHLGSTSHDAAPDEPAEFVRPADVNAVPRPSLSYLNLYSGPYEGNRIGGLTKTFKAFGWDTVTEFDNDRDLGGGWQDDLLNDSRYTDILSKAAAGAFDTITVAFPCTTTTPARCFRASGDDGDSGPPQVRDAEHPDGLPRDRLEPQYYRELLRANRLWDRTVEVMIAAHRSPRRTTLFLENPSDRSIPGTAQHMADISHGSLFATSGFKRLRQEIPNSSICTFANCMLGGKEQKYITIWYTNDAAPIMNKLNSHEYQCNHAPGTHAAIAGGRDERGAWRSKPTGEYLPRLCNIIAMAATFARTGDATPISLRRSQVAEDTPDPPDKPDRQPLGDLPELPSATERVDPEVARPNRSGTPRRLSFEGSPLRTDSVARPPPSLRGVSPAPAPPGTRPMSTLPSRMSRAPTPSPSLAPQPPPSPAVNLGGGLSHAPEQLPRQDARTRSVRSSTREATLESIANRIREDERARAARAARGRFDTIPEEGADDAPYTSFGGTPNEAWGEPGPASGSSGADDMEAVVASLIFDSSCDDAQFSRMNLTGWMDYCGPVPVGATKVSKKVRTFDATYDNLTDMIDGGGMGKKEHDVLLSARGGLGGSNRVPKQFGLRADSPGAPERYKEAMARGPPWPASIDKEFENHRINESWVMIDRSSVPAGRRIHKFVWVFKEKRDGTAKARLCIQGCTLEEGVDYDQTFAKPLRHASARGLFAYAARNRCKVRSVDLVAAYLQGEFIEGEVVYCRQPEGSNAIGSDGLPMICVIKKPIYGIPQAGRRLQRKFFPWCRDVMGMRQLDDSDDAVFVWDDPEGVEKFAIGIYVDNLQVVHSAEVDENGTPVDGNSFYAKFMSQLKRDWDVVDEGPMLDLLGIDCDRQPDGSILLHQTKYTQKMLSRFAPDGPKYRNCAVPYTADLPRLVIEALEGSTADAPAYPHLIRPYQQRVGALMYACTGTRPDLAYAVHQHCRCLSRPTPELMSELDRVFSYLYYYPNVGIRFTPSDGVLHGTADASWEVRASTSGWVVYWHGAPLTWGSRKQKSVSLSSCESEIVALSEAAKDVVYLRKLTRGLVPEMPEAPTVLSTDNKAARDLSYNPEHHDRSKHIERRHFFIRDMVENHEIIVPLVGTAENDADFFTKPLSPKRFKFLRRRVMNLEPAEKSTDERPSFAGGRWNAGG